MKKKIMLAVTVLLVVVMACVALVACSPKSPEEFLEAAKDVKSCKIAIIMAGGDEEMTLILAENGLYMESVKIIEGEKRWNKTFGIVADGKVDLYVFDGVEWIYSIMPEVEDPSELFPIELEPGMTLGEQLLVSLKSLIGEDMSKYDKKDGYWVNEEGIKLELNGKTMSITNDIESDKKFEFTLEAKVPDLPKEAKAAKDAATK